MPRQRQPSIGLMGKVPLYQPGPESGLIGVPDDMAISIGDIRRQENEALGVIRLEEAHQRPRRSIVG